METDSSNTRGRTYSHRLNTTLDLLTIACGNSARREFGLPSQAMGWMDMVSTPPAKPTVYKPALMAAATLAIACSPDEHCLQV